MSSYDEVTGNLRSITEDYTSNPADGLNIVTNFAYTPATDACPGLPTQIAAPENLITDIHYKPVSENCVIDRTTVDPAGEALTTYFGFNAVGDVTAIDGPRTDVTDIITTRFNANRQPVEQVDPLGNRTRTYYTLDSQVDRVESLAPADSGLADTILQVTKTITPTRASWSVSSAPA